MVITLPGRLSTSEAYSCVFPPTRMRTLPARFATVASRFKNGTWMNDLRTQTQRDRDQHTAHAAPCGNAAKRTLRLR